MVYECPCGYVSSDCSNIKRHKKGCKKLMSIDFEVKLLELQKIIERKDMELLSKDAQIEALNNKIESYTKSALSSGTTNVYNNNNQYNINIIPYGLEPVLDKEKVMNLLDKPDESVPRYIEMKHFLRGDTANVRITNKRGSTCQIVEEDVNSKRRRWVETDKKILLTDMAETNLDELRDTFDAETNVIWKSWYRSNGLHEDGYDKRDEFKKMVKAVENVIITNRCQNIIQ